MGQGVEGSRGRSPVGPLGGIFRGPRKTSNLPRFLAPEANFDCKTQYLCEVGGLEAPVRAGGIKFANGSSEMAVCLKRHARRKERAEAARRRA